MTVIALNLKILNVKVVQALYNKIKIFFLSSINIYCLFIILKLTNKISYKLQN